MAKLERVDIADVRKRKAELEAQEANARRINAIMDLKDALATDLTFDDCVKAIKDCAGKLKDHQPRRSLRAERQAAAGGRYPTHKLVQSVLKDGPKTEDEILNAPATQAKIADKTITAEVVKTTIARMLESPSITKSKNGKFTFVGKTK